MPEETQICGHCGGPILVMCRKNTGFCCEACKEAAE